LRRCSATRIDGLSHGLAGAYRPGGTHGVCPSQCCSCPRVSGVSAFRAHLPFPERPPRCIFVEGSAAQNPVTPKLI
jgi:hypothetical protein